MFDGALNSTSMVTNASIANSPHDFSEQSKARTESNCFTHTGPIAESLNTRLSN